MRLRLAGVLLFLVASAGCSRPIQSRKTDEDRIRDVHQIASLIEEYGAKKGRHPFAERWDTVDQGYVPVPISVHLSSRALPEEFQYPPRGVSGVVIAREELEEYLSRGLGRKIRLPCDDRPIRIGGANWPHFYQCLFDGKDYFVSCHLEKRSPFARELGRGLHKYEVGSVEIPGRQTRLYRSIRRDENSPE